MTELAAAAPPTEPPADEPPLCYPPEMLDRMAEMVVKNFPISFGLTRGGMPKSKEEKPGTQRKIFLQNATAKVLNDMFEAGHIALIINKELILPPGTEKITEGNSDDNN